MTVSPGLLIFGVDPGSTTGIAVLTYLEGHLLGEPILIQCNPPPVVPIISTFLRAASPARTLLAIEKFVVGTRAARSSDARAGSATRALIGSISALGDSLAGRVVLRSASEVKPWATDRRLEAAGFVGPKGMSHATDALRHALFAAVKDADVPDPLSRNAHRAPSP